MFSDGADADRATALRLVRDLNAGAGRAADVILFGDSITAGLARGAGGQAWAAAFRGVHAVPLGVRSATVEQLAWRMLRGGELPKRVPRVAVFFIGARAVAGPRIRCRVHRRACGPPPGSAAPAHPLTRPHPPCIHPPRTSSLITGVNNLLQGLNAPSEHLDWLLQWAQAAWPGTRLAVVALTPYAGARWPNNQLRAATNAAYRALAQRRAARFIECGQGWRPTDGGMYTDGLHLTAAGNRQLVACLRAGVAPLL